jgi:hypothetical protein
VLVPVGAEDDRPLARLLLEAVRVELGLLDPHFGVLLGPFRLDQGQGLPVVAPEDVIDVALPLCVRHPTDLDFKVPLLVQRPARLPQHEVDEVVAGLGLGVVVAVWLSRVGLLRPGDLGADLGQFRVGRLLGSRGLGQLLILLLELRLERLQLVQALLWDGRGLW